MAAGKAAEREIASAMAVPRRPSQGVTGFVQRLMSMRGLSSAVPGLTAQANGLLLAPQPDAYNSSSSEAARTLNGQPRANGHAVPTVLASHTSAICFVASWFCGLLMRLNQGYLRVRT